jgi:hypothetical protein
MIIKNKRTKDVLEMTYSEFRKKFAKEIQEAFGNNTRFFNEHCS